jgi:hypothetical protein
MADMDIQLAVRETIALLEKDDIIKAVADYKADSPEKETAAEYAKAYGYFIKDIAEHDASAGRRRADYELREHVGHINAMLKHKQPDIFMKMLLNCPKHYGVFMGTAAQASEKPQDKKPAAPAKPATKTANAKKK